MTQRNIAVTFPGQGAQRPGMGLAWRGTPGWAVVGAASQICGADLEWLLTEAGEPALRPTREAQLATLALELVIWSEIRHSGVLAGSSVVGFAGHSLGEFAALHAAGVLDAADAVRVVDARGRAMAEACRRVPGTMAVLIGLTHDQVEELTKTARAEGERVWPANLNSPLQVVVSGESAGVRRVGELAAAMRARVVALRVSGAFHTELMASADRGLAAALAGVRWGPAAVPVVRNIDAGHTTGPSEWPGALRRQLVSPVQWLDTVEVLTGELGAGLHLELGPGKALSGLARATMPELASRSVATPADLEALGAELAA